MAFCKPNINSISTDIRDLSIYIRTIKKFGKSTLFRDVIMEKYNDPSYGLLMSIGNERGDKLLANLNRVHVDTYKEFVELKQWLISTKGSEHHIEIIGFDTCDELFPIFETEVIRKYNVEEKPAKLCTSIKAAYGGFNRGVEETANMVKNYMSDLDRAGFTLWAIAHTKYKNIKQKGDMTDGYMQLTSNLVANYEAILGDIFDMTLTGVIDRELEEKEIDISGQKKTKRYATDAIRKLYFRGTNLIDAGSRFAAGAVPEYLVFDEPNMAKKFISTIEHGMENSKPEQIIAPTPVEVVSVPDDNLKDEVDAEALKKDILSKFKGASRDTKLSIKQVLRDNGHESLAEDVDVAVLNTISGMLK
nr:MAG TPA: AAA domain protein [Caudoviricetes sp.]